MEPQTLQRMAALPDCQLKDRHAPRAQQHRTAHLGNNACGFARLQFIEAAGILAVLITKRQMVEQVFGSLNRLGLEHLCHARSDAAHILNFVVEAGHTLDATVSGFAIAERPEAD